MMRLGSKMVIANIALLAMACGTDEMKRRPLPVNADNVDPQTDISIDADEATTTDSKETESTLANVEQALTELQVVGGGHAVTNPENDEETTDTRESDEEQVEEQAQQDEQASDTEHVQGDEQIHNEESDVDRCESHPSQRGKGNGKDRGKGLGQAKHCAG